VSLRLAPPHRYYRHLPVLFKVIDELVKAFAGDAAGAIGDVAEETTPGEAVDGFEVSLQVSLSCI